MVSHVVDELAPLLRLTSGSAGAPGPVQRVDPLLGRGTNREGEGDSLPRSRRFLYERFGSKRLQRADPLALLGRSAGTLTLDLAELRWLPVLEQEEIWGALVENPIAERLVLLLNTSFGVGRHPKSAPR